jgi:hypothetical protein
MIKVIVLDDITGPREAAVEKLGNMTKISFHQKTSHSSDSMSRIVSVNKINWRIMKRNFLQVVLLMSSLSPGLCLAFYEPESRTLPLEERFSIDSETEKLASEGAQKLVGHISLASMSIDYRLKTSAVDHLQTAKAEASALLKTSKDEKAEMKGLPFGKLVYDLGAEEKKYYVPIWLGEGLSQEYKDHSKGKGKGSKLEIKKSTIIHSTVRLNLKRLLELLGKAQKELSEDNYDQAQMTIMMAMNDTLVSEEVVKDPLLTIWSNLVLANDFIERSEFKSARFTLKKAQEEIKRLDTDKVLKNDAKKSKDLHLEIDRLAKVLDDKDPGIMKKVKKKIKEMVQKVKSWA